MECLDRAGIQYAWTALVYVFPFAVSDRLKAVPVTSFTEHVQGMHENRDKGFELEYQVSWSTLANRKTAWSRKRTYSCIGSLMYYAFPCSLLPL